MSMHGQYEQPITVYRDVSPRTQPDRSINCRTCQNAGMGACTLLPGQCSSGSAYVAAPVLRFWRQS
jgi:hypothetical protein